MPLVLKQPIWHDILESISRMHYQLVIIVGPVDSGKTSALQKITAEGYNVTSLNLGEELSYLLMDVPTHLRAAKAEGLASKIIEDSPSKTVSIDNIEILFEQPLEINPLAFLKRISQSKTIVVTWTGEYSNQLLAYGALGHPGRQEFQLSDQDNFYIIHSSNFS